VEIEEIEYIVAYLSLYSWELDCAVVLVEIVNLPDMSSSARHTLISTPLGDAGLRVTYPRGYHP
jgi:hypothetical protein